LAASGVQQSISALETIAFVLPGPWGPIASAALHIFGAAFSPNEADPNQPVLDAIKAGLNDLQSNATLNKIQEAQNYLATLDRWVNVVATYDTIALLDYYIGKMDDFDRPISDIDKVINALDVNVTTSLPNYLDLAQGIISTLISLQVSVLSIRNLRVLLQQRLVGLLQDSVQPKDQARVSAETEDLLIYYSSLRDFGIKPMVDPQTALTLKTRCDTIKAVMVAKVGAVTKSGYPPTPGSIGSANRESYSYTDENGNVRDTLQNSYRLSTISVPTNHGSIQVPAYVLVPPDQRAAVDALRTKYIQRLEASCDAFRDDQMSVYDAAKKLAAATRVAPPAPGPNPPDVVYGFDTGWAGAWKFAGKFVRYAIAYVGDQNVVPDESELIYSDWTACTQPDSVCPVVTLPVDAMGLAVSRIVYRDIADTAAGTNSVMSQFTIPNAAQTRLVDLFPVDADDVCPNVTTPPVAWNCVHDANNPKRTWPEPYRVRYRYRLQKTVKGVVCTSLDWSPWCVPLSHSGVDVDSSGFLYIAGYYGAVLTVPDPHDANCTFVLQRERKDQGVREIKCTFGKAPAFGTFYLTDDDGP
jgi:hypothetical protein